MYILDLISNTLEIRNYPNSDIWKDNSLELFHVENAKQVSYHDGGEEKICKLNENDFTIAVVHIQNILERNQIIRGIDVLSLICTMIECNIFIPRVNVKV